MIYLITNKINNKYYVGKTIQDINDRWSAHKYCSRKEKPEYYLHKAIKKYGSENFDIQVLSKETDDEKSLNLEKVWIILLQSRSGEYGYNLTNGGEGASGYKFFKKV